jgi:hypothetical protein
MTNPLSNINSLRDLIALRDSVVRGPPFTGPTSTPNGPSTVSTHITPTPTSPSPEPPVNFMDMPRNNVFLKHRKPTIKGFKDQWTDREYQQVATIAAQQDATNEDMDYSEDLELTTAATTHFGSQYYSARLFYDFQRMMEIMVFRYGSVPAERVTELMDMMPKGCVNGSNSQSIRKRLLAQQTQAKTNTQSFLLLSMEQLLVEVPDFRNATKEARISLVTRMFDQSKIAISENLFYVEAQSVSFKSIFRSNDDVHVRWQNFLRTRFVNLAMETYNILALDEHDLKGAKKKLGIYIDRHHMSAANIEEIVVGLGTYTDVPTSVYRSGMIKRHMVK